MGKGGLLKRPVNRAISRSAVPPAFVMMSSECCTRRLVPTVRGSCAKMLRRLSRDGPLGDDKLGGRCCSRMSSKRGSPAPMAGTRNTTATVLGSDRRDAFPAARPETDKKMP
jgi:hypothetical protein